jgi:hypothetical protein
VGFLGCGPLSDPAQAPVNSEYPSAASHHQTLGNQADDSMRPEYGEKDKHFRSWLASLSPAEAQNMASAQNLVLAGKRMPKRDETAVELVGEGSLGDGAPVTTR